MYAVYNHFVQVGRISIVFIRVSYYSCGLVDDDDDGDERNGCDVGGGIGDGSGIGDGGGNECGRTGVDDGTGDGGGNEYDRDEGGNGVISIMVCVGIL